MEANIQKIFLAQAFVRLPSLFKGFSLSQYDNMVDMTPSTAGGITCWPKIGQYLLTNYAEAKDNTMAIPVHRDTKQKSEENKKEISRRPNDAFSRCDNVFLPEEVTNMYIDGLTTAINYEVWRSRDTHERCTCMEAVQQAESEGDIFKARTALSSTWKKDLTSVTIFR